MKRFFAHYIFIFPDKFLRNCIIELDNENHITNTYPFSGEIANTEFVSGLIIFLPSDLKESVSNEELIKLQPKLEVFITTSNYLIRSFSI